jgi:hypothetical protein
MTTWRRIICLANSYKNGGRCIAGVAHNLLPALWVRPISAHDPVGLSERERQYATGDEPALLDIIEVPLVAQQTHQYQKENWVVDTSVPWKQSGTVDWDACTKYASKADTLWSNTTSTQNGLHDRVPLEQLTSPVQTLHLIRVTQMTISVVPRHEESRTKGNRVYGTISYRGTTYTLRITDPAVFNRYQHAPVGEYPSGEALLTVSLGEPYHGYAYKLIAAVMERR